MVGLLDVEVVGEQRGCAQHQWRVEGGDEAEVVVHGWIVVRRDDDDIDVAFTDAIGIVGQAINETASAAGVAVGRVKQISLGVELERAVECDYRIDPELGVVIRLNNRAPADEAQRIEIEVTVVAEQDLDRNDGRNILVDVDRVAPRDRRGIADIVEAQRDDSAIDLALVVLDEIAESRVAPIILVRGEHDRAVIGDFDVAVHCVASALEAYSEAFDVTVVFEQVEDRDLDRPILGPAQVLEATRLVAVVASIGTVVDGLVDDRRARPGGTAVTIVDLVVEPRLAVEIRRRREQHRGVVEQPGAAAVAAADRGDDQRIAVVLDVVGEQAVGADDDRVVFADRISGFGQGEAVSDRRGGIVDRRDGEADTSGRSGSRRVADDVVEIRRAPIVIGRRDVDQAVAAEADRDVAVALDRLDSQHVAVDIEIVGDQRARIDGERSSFGNRGDGIVARNRSVVDRGYLDRDFGLGAPSLGCIGDVGEFGGAVEIGSRREGNVAVARQRHRPVLRAIDLADDHPVSIEIVRKQPLDPDHEATVLGDGEAAVGQRGRDRADADIDARGVEAVAAVRQRVGDRGRAVIAADRSVANVALGIEGRHAVGPAIDRDDSQRVAIGVEIVA